MAKKGVSYELLRYLQQKGRPVSTREIAAGLQIAWHTADRYCLKLQVQGKISCFTIGKATAWHLPP